MYNVKSLAINVQLSVLSQTTAERNWCETSSKIQMTRKNFRRRDRG